MKRPKSTAMIATTGTVANMINESFQDKYTRMITPPTMMSLHVHQAAEQEVGQGKASHGCGIDYIEKHSGLL